MKVSFIIPLYNAERFIERCVHSIYKQDLPQDLFEIIIVDDGSTDNSLAIAKELSVRNHNIFVFSKENGGSAAARNLGIKKSFGDYLVFIDSDDYFQSQCLNKIFKMCLLNNLDILYYRLLIHYADESLPDELGGDYNGMPVHRIMDGLECYKRGFLASTMCGCIVRKSLLIDNGLEFSDKRYGEDALLSYCITAFAKKVMFLNDAPYIYFKNNDSVLRSMSINQHLRQIEDTLGVGYDLQRLSLEINNIKLSDILKRYSVNIIFGAYLEMWKSRKEFKYNNLLNSFITKLKEQGRFPFKGPFFSFKKWLVVKILINNKYMYL